MEDHNNVTINPNAVTHTLNAPQNVTLGAVTATTAQLSWGSSGPLTQGYRVFTITSGQKTLVATLGPTATTYTVTGLTPGATVSFVIQAFDGPTTAESDDPTATLPAAPVGGQPSSSSSASSNSSAPGATNGIFISDYLIGGRNAHVVQATSNSVAFINENGNVVLGTWVSATQAIVAAWGNDIATFVAGNIQWSDGSLWTKTTTSSPQLIVNDYTNAGNGLTSHVIQNGTNTGIFVNEHGSVVLGAFSGASQATVAPWGNDVATFGVGQITWSDGSIWNLNMTAPTLPVTATDYTINGLTAQVIRIGATAVVFINEHGSVVVGTMTDSTHAKVSAWNNLVATFSNGQVTWSNGSVWGPSTIPAPQYAAAAYTNAANGLTSYVIQINSNTAVFVNEFGSVVVGAMNGPAQATVAPWGNDVATFSSSKIRWSDGTVWTAKS
jgi:hypothetical protein